MQAHFVQNLKILSLFPQADSVMVHLINSFIQKCVFIEDDDEEMDDHTKIEELHKRRNFLVSILFNLFNSSLMVYWNGAPALSVMALVIWTLRHERDCNLRDNEWDKKNIGFENLISLKHHS